MRHPELDRDSLLAALGRPSLTRACELVGADYRTMLRAREGLSLEMAERWCEHAGLHPAEVFPQWVDLVLRAPKEREREWRRRYLQSPKGKATHREANIRWYRSMGPAARRLHLAKVREYYAANRERVRAQQATYYAANRERIQARRRTA